MTKRKLRSRYTDARIKLIDLHITMQEFPCTHLTNCLKITGVIYRVAEEGGGGVPRLQFQPGGPAVVKTIINAANWSTNLAGPARAGLSNVV